MKQKKKAALSREQIISAAMEEFSEFGFAKATINSICRNGEISKGKLYHYYESKEDLYCACIEYCYEKIAPHMESFVADTAKTLEENIISYFELWQSFWSENKVMINLMVESKVLPPPGIGEKLYKMRSDVIELYLKPSARKVFTPFNPNDTERQVLLGDCLWAAIDYIAFNLGVQKYKLKGYYEGFYEEQTILFKKVVHMFMHIDISKYN